uniref:sn-1-specific diacylglycerol lipase ABHD11 n=1 Tax=Clastoptera arizonana TaxID=38151 RepID=A0A1B6BZT1_9HEMI
MIIRSNVLLKRIDTLFSCNIVRTCTSFVDIRDKYSPVDLQYTSYLPKVENEIKKPPIIILHGILGARSNWNTLAKTIADKTSRQVLALDARNHGESGHSDNFSYHHMASDVVDFMEKLNISNATLIGHSMGGRTSMLLSLLYPAMVESLIIVDISPQGISPGFNKIPLYLKAMSDFPIDNNANISENRKACVKQLIKVTEDKMLSNFLSSNLVNVYQNHHEWRINLKSLINHIEHIGDFDCDIGKSYKGSTLFIGGGNSDYINEKTAPIIKKLFPAAKIEIIKDCGHWLHVEKPTEFCNLTCNFINQ